MVGEFGLMECKLNTPPENAEHQLLPQSFRVIPFQLTFMTLTRIQLSLSSSLLEANSKSYTSHMHILHRIICTKREFLPSFKPLQCILTMCFNRLVAIHTKCETARSHLSLCNAFTLDGIDHSVCASDGIAFLHPLIRYGCT